MTRRSASSPSTFIRVYYERQTSALCGAHCLNNLLSGPYFDLSDFSDAAAYLDSQEAALGLASVVGQNADAAGNFSVQVLERVLKSKFPKATLSMAGDNINDALVEARMNVRADAGFVLNKRNHWYAIRTFKKLDAGHYYDLNSISSSSTTIADGKALRAFTQAEIQREIDILRNDGWSVFCLHGLDVLPDPIEAPSDKSIYLECQCLNGVAPTTRAFVGSGRTLIAREDEESTKELAAAIAMSLKDQALLPEPDAGIKVQLICSHDGKRVRHVRKFSLQADAMQLLVWAASLGNGALLDSSARPPRELTVSATDNKTVFEVLGDKPRPCTDYTTKNYIKTNEMSLLSHRSFNRAVPSSVNASSRETWSLRKFPHLAKIASTVKSPHVFAPFKLTCLMCVPKSLSLEKALAAASSVRRLQSTHANSSSIGRLSAIFSSSPSPI